MIPFPLRRGGGLFHPGQSGYVEGEPETYVLPLAVALGEQASRVQAEFPQAVVARLRSPGPGGPAL